MKPPMTAMHVVPLVLASLLLACAPERPAQASITQAAAAAPTAHYCNMGAFTAAERARLEDQLVPNVAAAVTGRRELENGYLFTLSGQLNEAGEWVDLVRRCCPTLDFHLTFSHGAGPTELRITGAGTGAKAFIREEFRAISGKAG